MQSSHGIQILFHYYSFQASLEQAEQEEEANKIAEALKEREKEKDVGKKAAAGGKEKKPDKKGKKSAGKSKQQETPPPGNVPTEGRTCSFFYSL